MILATAAERLIPNISGIKRDNVITAWGALQGKEPIGRWVVALGIGSIGWETAIFSAKKGKMDAETSVVLVFYVTL